MFILLMVILVLIILYFFIEDVLRMLSYLKAASKLKGPFAYPLIGNALSFYGPPEEVFHKFNKMVGNLNNPIRIWMGPRLLIVPSSPKDIEKIIMSSKFICKHDIYDFGKDFLGEGLITCNSIQYKQDKKVMQPIFNLNFCKENIPLFQRNIEICLKKLEKYVDKGVFDVMHDIHCCFLDITGKMVFGTDINSQENENLHLCDALNEIYRLMFKRGCSPWLHPNFIYKFSALKKRQDIVNNIIRSFLKKAVQKSKDNIEQNITSNYLAIVDRLIYFTMDHPGLICKNDEDLYNHLVTIYSATEDTISTISAFTLLCFGMNPKYQQKALEEIHHVIGESCSNISLDALNKLEYLDMCIKDVLRLFPIGPIIIRKPSEDVHFYSWFIPKGAATVIPIFLLHRNKLYWEHPEEFYPDHFLPEAVKSRPEFTYLPFSAGPRKCIGKLVANMGMKLFLCRFLKKYEVFRDGSVSELKIHSDISVRSSDGYKISIRKRNWNKIIS